MRHIKMLSLAGASALVALAFIGMGTGSADSACLVDPAKGGALGECPAGSIWKGPIVGLAPNVLFEAGNFREQCSSEFLADYDENKGEEQGVLYLVLTLVFKECETCEKVVAENLPYLLLILMVTTGELGGEHGVLTEDGQGSPAFLFEKCKVGEMTLNCLYEPKDEKALLSYELELKEGKPLVGAFRAANTQIVRGGDSMLCPDRGFPFFEATYLIYEDKEKAEGAELFFTAKP